jgi:hypothetical protein
MWAMAGLFYLLPLFDFSSFAILSSAFCKSPHSVTLVHFQSSSSSSSAYLYPDLPFSPYFFNARCCCSNLSILSSFSFFQHDAPVRYLEQTFNTYSISLFMVYCTIWCRAFGDVHYPQIAAAIERCSTALLSTYVSRASVRSLCVLWCVCEVCCGVCLMFR